MHHRAGWIAQRSQFISRRRPNIALDVRVLLEEVGVKVLGRIHEALHGAAA